MVNWHDKHDIKERFGWSFKQFKARLSNLEDHLEGHYQGGNGQAYRVDNYGMEVLNRQYELEREGLGVSEASRKVINEQKTRKTRKDSEAKVEQGELKVKMEALERENELLRERLEKQDQQIEHLHNLIPGEVEEGNGGKDEFKEMGFFQLFKRWLTTKA